jgi:hypothetical protein
MASLLATEELEKPADDGFWGAEGQGGALWTKMDKGIFVSYPSNLTT